MCELTKTNGAENSDATVGAELVTTDPTIGEDGIDVLGDSAYASGEMLHRLNQMQWTPLVKPWPIKPAVEGGFTVDDFAHDPVEGTLTCPAGVDRRSPRTDALSSGSRAASVRCGRDAPPPRTAGPSPFIPTTSASADTASEPPTRASKPPTASTGRWSNAPSPGSPAARYTFPTAASRRTTAGSTIASPPSTRADSSPWASPSRTEPGPCPDRPRSPLATVSLAPAG